MWVAGRSVLPRPALPGWPQAVAPRPAAQDLVAARAARPPLSGGSGSPLSSGCGGIPGHSAHHHAHGRTAPTSQPTTPGQPTPTRRKGVERAAPSRHLSPKGGSCRPWVRGGITRCLSEEGPLALDPLRWAPVRAHLRVEAAAFRTADDSGHGLNHCPSCRTQRRRSSDCQRAAQRDRSTGGRLTHRPCEPASVHRPAGRSGRGHGGRTGGAPEGIGTRDQVGTRQRVRVLRACREQRPRRIAGIGRKRTLRSRS